MKIKWSIPDIGEEETNAVNEAMKEGWISGFGPRIKEFEKKVQEKLNVKHAIAVCNGTCGLISSFLAMKKLLLRKIIIAVPTWTFFATVASADLVGRIELVDALYSTFNMDVQDIPSNVDVICPVDAGGLPADYDSLKKLHKPIIGDCCESFGANYHGKKIGSIMDAGIFSFYATKIITTGEGGMIVTDRDDLAEIIRNIINQGYKDMKSYKHSMRGYNFRMPELAAAIGLVQLKKLDKYIRHRNELARVYKDILTDYVEFQHIPINTLSAYYLFTILVHSYHHPRIRDRLLLELTNKKIPTRMWTPMHYQPPFKYLDGCYPIADQLYLSNIHLPIHNLMTEQQVLYIAETIKKYIVRTRRSIRC